MVTASSHGILALAQHPSLSQAAVMLHVSKNRAEGPAVALAETPLCLFHPDTCTEVRENAFASLKVAEANERPAVAHAETLLVFSILEQSDDGRPAILTSPDGSQDRLMAPRLPMRWPRDEMAPRLLMNKAPSLPMRWPQDCLVAPGLPINVAPSLPIKWPRDCRMAPRLPTRWPQRLPKMAPRLLIDGPQYCLMAKGRLRQRLVQRPGLPPKRAS